jgi:photosystem II stability/assembly factor-like uncharacterized protein
MKKSIIIIPLLITFAFVVGCSQLENRAETRNPPKWPLITDTNLVHGVHFSPLKFFDSKTGLAVGGLSIQKTEDEGRTWFKIFGADGTQGYYAGVFTNEQNGFVVGTENREKPLILRTKDSGRTWLKVEPDKNSSGENERFTYFRDLCVTSPDTVWVVGDGGIAKISISEQNFQFSDIFNSQKPLEEITCDDAGTPWSIGYDNSILFYKAQWVKKDLDLNYKFTNIRSFGKEIWVTGGDDKKRGVLLKSPDGGGTWEIRSPESAGILNDVYFADSKGWLIGNDGAIFYSSDAGTSWTKSEKLTEADLFDLYFRDSSHGWIGGDKTTILKYGD